MATWFQMFFGFLLLYGSAVLVWWHFWSERLRKQIVKNLATGVNAEGTVRTTVLVEKPTLAAGLAQMIKSGRSPKKAGNIDTFSRARFFLVTLLGAVGGFIVGMKLTGIVGVLAPFIGAFAGGSLPRMYRAKHRDKRLAAIEDQFPDALDFLARSVRAGNAFSIALELLAGEAQEPMKSEITRITRELALGASLEDGLKGFIARVPLIEARMFVAAVLLQRETGGNLSEVLAKLAGSVRDRVRLRGHVMAATGQSRMTAQVLTWMPVAILLGMKLISPAYIDGMIANPIGRNLLGVGLVSMILGHKMIQAMIKVEV